MFICLNNLAKKHFLNKINNNINIKINKIDRFEIN